eukprot:5361166-Ditylum_brightwellii.AAC.1
MEVSPFMKRKATRVFEFKTVQSTTMQHMAPALGTLHEILIHLVGKQNGGKTQSSTSTTGLRKSEKTLICRWNALDEAEWAAKALPVFKHAEREGTSKQVIWGALRTQLQQSISRELPATVFVSDALISDINDLNFGWIGNLS